jgi:type IV pilus assembly protein PilC
VVEEGKGSSPAAKKKGRRPPAKGKAAGAKGGGRGQGQDPDDLHPPARHPDRLRPAPAARPDRARQTGTQPGPETHHQRARRFRPDRLHLLRSLAQHPKIFNKLYVNMVKAGELGGVLEVVLNRLAEYQEKAQKLKNKIVSAMVYPVIVMFIAVAIMVFLILFIVPKFKKIFEEMLGPNRCPHHPHRHRASGWLIERPFILQQQRSAPHRRRSPGHLRLQGWGRTKGGRQGVDRSS